MIISGFAGIGKTTFAKTHPDNAIDLESSDYKWIFDDSIKGMGVEERKGQTQKIPNPEYPGNYIKAIKEANESYDFVFICMDADVRRMLEAENISYAVAYPTKECKGEYIKRYEDRNNNPNFVKLLKDQFDGWVEALYEFKGTQIQLHPGEYLSDKLEALAREEQIENER